MKKFKAVPPCKDCAKRQKYLSMGLNCHTYCKSYIEYSEERRKICEYNTVCAIVNKIHRDSRTHNNKKGNNKK